MVRWSHSLVPRPLPASREKWEGLVHDGIWVMFHVEPTWNRLIMHGSDFVSWPTCHDFVACLCLSITGGKTLPYSKISKQVRKVPVIISNALNLVFGMVTCRHVYVPGPPTFLMNVEKLGVAWGWGYWSHTYQRILTTGKIAYIHVSPPPTHTQSIQLSVLLHWSLKCLTVVL